MLLHVHVSLFHNARIKVLKIPQHVIAKKIPMTLKQSKHACSRRSDSREREKNSRRKKNEGRLEGERRRERL